MKESSRDAFSPLVNANALMLEEIIFSHVGGVREDYGQRLIPHVVKVLHNFFIFDMISSVMFAMAKYKGAFIWFCLAVPQNRI